jgi:hypothetical protein
MDPDPDAARRKVRFGELPKPIEVADMVESEPESPPPEPTYDPNIDAIRWFGIPL